MSMSTPLVRPWYIVGLPGSGKSRVGQRLASFFGVEHIDTDTLVEETTGRKISDIFDEDGEAFFRALEAEAVESTYGLQAVVSLGGGAVETQSVRDYLSDQNVIWIDAGTEELLSRISRNNRRPLMRHNPEETLHRLRSIRDPLFRAVADVKVTSTSAPVQAVVRKVLRSALDWDFSTVKSTESYRVITGAGTSSVLDANVPAQATKAFVVAAQSLLGRAATVEAELQERGLAVTVFTHADGEGAKDLDVAARGWDAMGEARIGRRDLVVTVGGGVTTDLGGFLAATWLRGVSVIHMPTSLLAMVDASVGGKTGINTAAGKNLVGAFHDPSAVIIDLDMLRTLPQAEYAAGMAEAIKTGFIRDAQILADVVENPQISDVHWATTSGMAVLADIVRRSVAVKAQVVSEDRLEGGLREILNYGHTMGHAIERAEHYTMRHGEAVAIGSIFAAVLARNLGIGPQELIDDQTRVYGSMGLPTSYEGDVATLMEGLASDKKVRAGAMRFVLLEAQGKPKVVTVDAQDVRFAAETLGMDGANA